MRYEPIVVVAPGSTLGIEMSDEAVRVVVAVTLLTKSGNTKSLLPTPANYQKLADLIEALNWTGK